MKFQLKALVAALAFVAAVPAQAAINHSLQGNSSFVLSIWDSAANISASFDLGKNYSDFNIKSPDFAISSITATGTSFAFDLTAGDYATAWSNFAAVANEANAEWAITAADALGNAAGTLGLITTYSGGEFQPLSSNGVTTAAALYDAYTQNLGTIQSNYQNHETPPLGGAPGVPNGANTAVAGTLSYAPTGYYDLGRNAGVGPNASGFVGQSLQLVQVLNGSSSRAQVTNTIFGNGAAFTLTSAGQLTYSAGLAPIPEADTWAMMLLGLGFMGFVARRKQA